MIPLSNEEQTAMLVFKRISRFIEGYNILEELESLLSEFKNTEKIKMNGLGEYYMKLKEKVIQENKIGLIIYGLTISDSENKSLGVYTTSINTKINLNLKSICYYLRKDYFTTEEIKDLCFKTPNFNIYYNQFKIE
tara:strand:- start:75 stop:482 length:408 start_codon:yes stop_codon:yes gene_type:complete